jgi:hypothetical protein
MSLRSVPLWTIIALWIAMLRDVWNNHATDTFWHGRIIASIRKWAKRRYEISTLLDSVSSASWVPSVLVLTILREIFRTIVSIYRYYTSTQIHCLDRGGVFIIIYLSISKSLSGVELSASRSERDAPPKEPQISNGYEAGRASGPVSMLWSRMKYVATERNGTQLLLR